LILLSRSKGQICGTPGVYESDQREINWEFKNLGGYENETGQHFSSLDFIWLIESETFGIEFVEAWKASEYNKEFSALFVVVKRINY